MVDILTKNNTTYAKRGTLRQQFHWYIMMIAMVVGVLGLLLRGIYIFTQVRNDQLTLENVQSSETKTIFDVENLDTAILYFDVQSDKHDELTVAPPVVTDPS